MILYTQHNSPRLKFVVNFLNEHFFSAEIEIRLQSEKKPPCDSFCINYTAQNFSNCHHIIPEGLLFEKTIRPISDAFSRTLQQRKKADIFSRIFYALSAYQEYQIQEKDEHGRFSPDFLSEEKQVQLQEPFIDNEIIAWIKKMEKECGQELLSKRAFSFECTFDIDLAFAYKGRSVMRTAASSFKNILQSKSDLNKERIDVLAGRKKDPFDNFEYLLNQLSKYNMPGHFFFLMNEKGKFDRAVSPNSPDFINLVYKIATHNKVGIHPSYSSHQSTNQLKKEKDTLEELTKRACESARQHYLKFKLPETFRNLIQLGIEKEYSMGFSARPSFRLGTSFSVNWYDLEKEEITNLKLFPLQWMDSSFIYESAESPVSAEKSLLNQIEKVKKVGGHFIMNWHNNHLCDNAEFGPWRVLFEKALKSLSKS